MICGRGNRRTWDDHRTAAATSVVGAALALGLGLSALTSTAAQAATVAGVDLAPAAAAFKAGDHVYVYPGSGALVGAAAAAKISSAIGDGKVHVAVIRNPPIAQADAKPLVDALAKESGNDGSYVILGVGGEGTFTVINSPLDASVYGRQLRAALAAHHGDPAGNLQQLAGALAADPLPTKPFPWGAVIGWGIAIVAVVGLVAVVWRRQRRRRATLTALRDDARTGAESLADDLLITDPAGRHSITDVSPDDMEQRALKVAWSRLQAAQAMLSDSADTATVRRAAALTAQGRAALEQAQRLHSGVPEEAEVLRLAAQSGGPDPAARRDQPESPPPQRQQLLREYTPASYPGYGYGWYPGYGYGFFGYGGSFVTGILAGELLADAFSPWGGYGGFGGYGGYDVGFDSGYDTGYQQGYDQAPDPAYGTDPGYGADAGYGNDPGYGTDPGYGNDPGYSTDSWSGDSGGFDGGGDSGGFDGGGDSGGGW